MPGWKTASWKHLSTKFQLPTDSERMLTCYSFLASHTLSQVLQIAAFANWVFVWTTPACSTCEAAYVKQQSGPRNTASLKRPWYTSMAKSLERAVVSNCPSFLWQKKNWVFRPFFSGFFSLVGWTYGNWKRHVFSPSFRAAASCSARPAHRRSDGSFDSRWNCDQRSRPHGLLGSFAKFVAILGHRCWEWRRENFSWKSLKSLKSLNMLTSLQVQC